MDQSSASSSVSQEQIAKLEAQVRELEDIAAERDTQILRLSNRNPVAPSQFARELTYIMIKPDGVQRGLIGEIMARFEKKGFKLVAMKLTSPTRSLLEKHYGKFTLNICVSTVLYALPVYLHFVHT